MSHKDQYSKAAERWIAKARSNSNLGHTHLEKPAMLSFVDDDLSGKSVLCLGVGSGEETEYYANRGASDITGIDNSAKLIVAARQQYHEHEFHDMDMAGPLQFEDSKFDVVVSSLAMHYLPRWTEVLEEIGRVLKSGGTFVFSTHHPIYWSAEKVKTEDGYQRVLGFRYYQKDKSLTVYGDYLNTKNITDEIIKGVSVNFYHRPLSEMINELLDSSLTLVHVAEPKPQPSAREIDGNWYKKVNVWPPFIIFALRKDADGRIQG